MGGGGVIKNPRIGHKKTQGKRGVGQKFLTARFKHKHFSCGSRLGNKLLTRLRLGRSYLNSDGYAIGKVESPSCLCHHRNETIKHYMLECFLYTIERKSLFDQVKQLVTNFDRMSQQSKLDMLMFGYPDTDHLLINKKLTLLVQTYILQTKWFLE